jgi:tetratricopeptide (TPR) repeat protein/predicted Ser/Thr protein kinase
MLEPATGTRDLPGSRVDRFVIQAKLGGGGMGEVFLAEDSLLRRRVAVKAIRPEHSHDPDFLHRLHKEAERASQLNNEHIARIYDLVEDNGRLFLVMEYVEGETLRSHLRGPLPLVEWFSLAEQSLSALVAAHQHGILHCDLKPENLMITAEGVVKILDFGLSRQVQQGDSTTTTIELTSATAGGTPGYMAPEVLLGSAPDERCDIFSMGVVLYEALYAEHPFRRAPEHTAARTDQRNQSAPKNVKPPAGLEQVLARMMAKEPEQRYRHCSDALADIRAVQAGEKPALGSTGLGKGRLILRGVTSLAVVALLGLVFAVSVGHAGWLQNISWLPWSTEKPAEPHQMLAVLPFAPAAQDASSRAFADGLTEVLAARLARPPLETVPVSELRAQNVKDAKRARAVLGATLALVGSLQQSGDTVRVTFSLVDTRTHRQLNSGVITADASNPFAVQDRVIEEVLTNLNIELEKEERAKMAAHGTAQAPAYEHYLRGKGYLQAYDRMDSLDSAISEFRLSLQSDANFALAHAGLGQAYMDRYELSHQPESLEAARQACTRTLELENGGRPDGEICLGMVFNATGQYQKAAEHLEKALNLDSGREETYRQLAIAYEGMRRPADAEALLKKAVAQKPQYWAGYKALGWFYDTHGRYDEAAEQFKRVVELAPDNLDGYSNLGAVYIKQGKYAEAIDALERSIKIQPAAAALNNLGALYFFQRKYEEAAGAYERAAKMTPDDYRIFGNLGEVYGQMDGEQAESRRNYAQGLRLAEQRLGANPNDGDALLHAALYAAMLGLEAKAEKYRRSGIGISGHDPEARLNSALVLAQLHQDGRALDELDRALKVGLPASEVTDNPAWRRFAGNPRFEAVMARTQNKRRE